MIMQFPYDNSDNNIMIMWASVQFSVCLQHSNSKRSFSEKIKLM
jgi:hypothetical protein